MTVELWVYGDESSIEPSEPYAAISGFIASPAQWNRFNDAWRKVIRGAGIREFHAGDFFRRHSARQSDKNEFSGWSDRHADTFMDELLKVLRDFKGRVKPVGSTLDTKAFFEFTWGERNFLTGASWNNVTKKFVSNGAPTRTYSLPFFSMVGLALEEAQPGDCKIHFRMDEQKVVQSGIQELFIKTRTMERIPPHLRLKMGDLHPGRSEDHEGIQAADLLAHISAATYAKREALSRDRLRALRDLSLIWTHLDPGVVSTRGMEYILRENLSPEDRVLVKAFKSQAERQPPRVKRQWPTS